MTSVPEAERRRGYARWKGATRGPNAFAWWVVARGNLALALSNKWVKTLLVASLIPGVILAGVTYFFLPLSAVALDIVLDFTAVSAFLVAAVVGARLVSDDRKQGAFLAHFSRPVTRYDYMIGKFLALALPLLFVTTAPALLGILADLAVDSETVADRIRDQGGIQTDLEILREASYWEALGAVAWFGLVISLATSGIVLGVSALTTRARIAGVIWFAIVAFGQAAHGIIHDGLEKDWSALLSWFDGVWDTSSFLLGFEDAPGQGRDLEYDLATRAAVLLAAGAAGLVVVHEKLRRAEGGEK